MPIKKINKSIYIKELMRIEDSERGGRKKSSFSFGLFLKSITGIDFFMKNIFDEEASSICKRSLDKVHCKAFE